MIPSYRNRVEARVAATLDPSYAYESTHLPYVLAHRYLPDFIDPVGRRIVEVKGRFTAADRAKMRAVRQQYGDWQIEMRFQRPHTAISKTSKTTYASWCERHGIQWSQA